LAGQGTDHHFIILSQQPQLPGCSRGEPERAPECEELT